MMKTIIFLILCMFGGRALSQNLSGGTDGLIYLTPIGGSENKEYRKGTYIGPHFFGDTLTVKKDLFERNYIYYKPGTGAYAVEEKVVKRPAIYKAIEKVDAALTKEATTDIHVAMVNRSRLETIYDIGIKLSRYNTTQVEKALKKMKDPKKIEEYLLSLRYN